MPKPICVKCRRFFKPARNGVRVLEQMPVEKHAQPGTEDEDRWKPYKLWQADLLRCNGCGTEIIVGFGMEPSAEHYEPEFQQKLAHAAYTVNDC